MNLRKLKLNKKIFFYSVVFILIAISFFYYIYDNKYSITQSESVFDSNSKGQFIPEQKTDFIFTTSNESLEFDCFYLLLFLSIVVLLFFIIKKNRAK